jgi:hypothetical protein
MGFRPEPTIYTLNFDDVPTHAGLRVRIACCTIGQMNKMFRSASTNAAVADANDEITLIFLDHLKDWNLDNPATGDPLDKTVDGINSLEPSFFAQIVVAWQVSMLAIPTNLKSPSMNGGQSEEASLGLGDISESLPNWPQPS